MEDYREKYEMALEGVQEILSSGEDSIKMSRLELRLRGIFPELHESESEDERIRKRIYNYINVALDDNENAEKEKWLAWLEKQGESIKINRGKNYLCTKTHKYAGEEWREGIKYFAPEDYTLINQGCAYYCPSWSKEEHNNFF